MRTIIIAPHPDDEWIGCGCTILKKSDNKERIKVLLITRKPKSENRVKISQGLAKKYGYELNILGESERNIDGEKLLKFLKSNITSDDIIYVPAKDNHPDHETIAKVARKLKNKKIEYATYNVSRDPFIKLKNKISSILKNEATSSFMHGKEDKILRYKLDIKNKNIIAFGETPRGGDVLRKLR